MFKLRDNDIEAKLVFNESCIIFITPLMLSKETNQIMMNR